MRLFVERGSNGGESVDGLEMGFELVCVVRFRVDASGFGDVSALLSNEKWYIVLI